MSDTDKVLAEIKNSKEMIKCYLSELEKLEDRVKSGAIPKDAALKCAADWEKAVQMNYDLITILKNQL